MLYQVVTVYWFTIAYPAAKNAAIYQYWHIMAFTKEC